MRDDSELGPRFASDPATEALAADGNFLLGFFQLRPPRILEVIEVEIGPSCPKLGQRRADLAGETKPFSNHRFNSDGQVELLRDDLRGLERSNVGAGDQASSAQEMG